VEERVPLFLPGAFSQTSPEERLGHHGDVRFPRLFPNHHTIMTLGPRRVVEQMPKEVKEVIERQRA
jgi:hypothetical protein